MSNSALLPTRKVRPFLVHEEERARETCWPLNSMDLLCSVLNCTEPSKVACQLSSQVAFAIKLSSLEMFKFACKFYLLLCQHLQNNSNISSIQSSSQHLQNLPNSDSRRDLSRPWKLSSLMRICNTWQQFMNLACQPWCKSVNHSNQGT